MLLIAQIVIAICGLSSVYLSQDARPAWRRWACIFGLCAQPAWLYATVAAEQWGIVCLVFVYTWGWYRGFRNFWLLKKQS